MGGADPGADERQRDESPVEQLDRNWNELLQELRVVQTGVQLLTGFWLTLPFQQRFQSLTHQQRAIYLTAVASSIAATTLLIAPVTLHRILFRRDAVQVLVNAAHLLALAGSLMLGLALATVTVLLYDVVLNARSGFTAGSCALAAVVVLWVVGPLVVRARAGLHAHGVDAAPP